MHWPKKKWPLLFCYSLNENEFFFHPKYIFKMAIKWQNIEFFVDYYWRSSAFLIQRVNCDYDGLLFWIFTFIFRGKFKRFQFFFIFYWKSEMRFIWWNIESNDVSFLCIKHKTGETKKMSQLFDFFIGFSFTFLCILFVRQYNLLHFSRIYLWSLCNIAFNERCLMCICVFLNFRFCESKKIRTISLSGIVNWWHHRMPYFLFFSSHIREVISLLKKYVHSYTSAAQFVDISSKWYSNSKRVFIDLLYVNSFILCAIGHRGLIK